MTRQTETKRVRLHITGQVQGVGFRPFVYRLARQIGLAGWVVNDARGVTIELQGPGGQLGDFTRRLRDELPPLAQIARFDREEIPPDGHSRTFEIRPSASGEIADAQITVDTAVCGDCLREMNTPSDPRYRYPFINCTNCGPRYTIVTGIPYDRPNTTMIDFAMCPLCSREYKDPASRRFHAQPIACPACGPSIRLTDNHGVPIDCDDAIAEAARLLAAGKILAIKGLGGFQLACRADDDHVVGRLRRRKRRDAKPLALMVGSMDVARSICELTPEAEKLLAGHIRPIVILPARKWGQSPFSNDENGAGPHLRIAASVAQGLNTLGLMLPYTPLHHLLFAQEAVRQLPLVMTSGNYSEEPLVKDNDAAIAHMGRIADVLLLHNRRIERRVDDSVVQLSGTGELVSLRRARGYAPQPVRLGGVGLDAGGVSVLAVGGELKGTICLLAGDRAVVSEHIGDMKDGRAYRHWIDTINHLEKLFEVRPEIIAADMHPQYLSTGYALKRQRGELSGKAGVPCPVVRVQHHYAHIAACLAENGFAGKAIGLACDGTGYGQDGAVWGCEVFEADLSECRRLGHLKYIHLPGGDLAAVETARPAMGALYDAFGDGCLDVARRCGLAIGQAEGPVMLEMLKGGVNCPASSSLGRWFDAIAALAGVADANRFEGQAPMQLEAAMKAGVESAYPFSIIECENKDSPGGDVAAFAIDLRPMVEQVAQELQKASDRRAIAGEVSARFHNTTAEFLLTSTRRAREMTGLGVVALSGGCFANRYLTARLVEMLQGAGFTVLRHRTMPCNDASVSLGQAVVAATRAKNGMI